MRESIGSSARYRSNSEYTDVLTLDPAPIPLGPSSSATVITMFRREAHIWFIAEAFLLRLSCSDLVVGCSWGCRTVVLVVTLAGSTILIASSFARVYLKFLQALSSQESVLVRAFIKTQSSVSLLLYRIGTFFFTACFLLLPWGLWRDSPRTLSRWWGCRE